MIAQTTAWRAADIAAAAHQTDAALPVIAADAAVAPLPGLVVWDMWPVAHEDGRTVRRQGRELWFFLTAPRRADPDLRHDEARIRLLSLGDGSWRDHGDALPDGVTPGSREWSGSAVLGPDEQTLTLYFTAAGRRGGPRSFEQRLFETRAQLRVAGDAPELTGWTPPVESLAADGRFYARADQTETEAGILRGFRDPGFFRDPTDGSDYLLFTGSAPDSPTPYAGVIGAARREGGAWRALPPLIDAVGVNAELERPHIVARDGLLYLFWSTQRARFAPGGPAGPTGLYGMVADRIDGAWRPLNGSGLVAANPAEEPYQAYCWWVTGELDVISFADFPALRGADPAADPTVRLGRFAGSVAPFFRLALDGDRARVVRD